MPARKFLSGLLAAVLFAALPAAAKDIVWKQQTITIAKNPSRIAVYDPAALDILESLGVQTASYNDGGGQPDPAKLAAEPPELIILGGATAGRLKDTAAIAPSLDLTPDTDGYLTDLAARTMLLADIFGKSKAAEQKLKAVSNKRAILKQRTEGKTAVFLLMENGGFIPQSEDDRFGFFYTLSGLYTPDNADLTHHPEDRPPAPLPEKASSRQKKAAREAEEKRLAEQNARLEKLLAARPDYIAILNPHADASATRAELQKHPVLGRYSAQTILLDTGSWYRIGAGLDNTARMLDELIRATD